MRKTRRILCRVACLFMYMSLWPLFGGCSHNGSPPKDHFDLKVETPEDVERLNSLDKALTVTSEFPQETPGYRVVKNVAVPWAPEYRIGAGDMIEIVYHLRYEDGPEEYKIGVQDKISIHLPYYPQFGTTATVRTDGRISVPLLGEISVESKTPGELSALLNKEYGKFIKKPDVSVSMEEFNVKTDEFRNASRGQHKVAPVAPDGRISFPMIGTCQAEGFTVTQLEAQINEAYARQLRNLNVTLILLEIHHPKIYVLGDVGRPGAYEMRNRMNLLDALAIANGHKMTSSELREVVVFRNYGLSRPTAFKVDARAILDHAADINVQLRPADIIYISKTKLNNINIMLEKIFPRGLYAISPVTNNFNINANSTSPANE